MNFLKRLSFPLFSILLGNTNGGLPPGEQIRITDDDETRLTDDDEVRITD